MNVKNRVISLVVFSLFICKNILAQSCIIVMDKGEIQQMGPHEELIRQEGPYRDIYEIQMNSDIRLMEEGAV